MDEEGEMMEEGSKINCEEKGGGGKRARNRSESRSGSVENIMDPDPQHYLKLRTWTSKIPGTT